MPLEASSNIAPGPPAHFLLGHLREFRTDVLGLLLQSSHRYGDVVRFRLGPAIIHLINEPEAIEQILQKRAQNYDKATRSARFIRMVCGQSLLTSNGASWQNQRRLLQPFFHQQSIKGFADLMVASTLRTIELWQARADRACPLDMASEMMQLTYRIAAKAFFDAAAGEQSQTIERAMQVILPYIFGRLEHVLNLPRWVPTPKNVRFRQALRAIDTVVYQLMERHRVAPESSRSGMLGMLLGARDAETGQGLSDRQIRDQTITFLLAGHETTSNALTWTFYLLAKHPVVQQRFREEVRGVLHGSAPSLEALPQLQSVRNVIREAMRLYPPIWIIERHVIAEDEVHGFRLPAGSAVVVCPYTLHRHPVFWEKPEEFRPERFAKDLPRAYIPFGAGPRYCIGSEFAMLEAQLITALVVQNFQLHLVPGRAVSPKPGITLRTEHGLPMTLLSVT